LCPSFVSLIDPSWKSMFIKLRGAQTSFSHAFMQPGITFLLQLKRYTFLLRVWQLPIAPSLYAFSMDKHFWWTSITTRLLGLSWKMIPFFLFQNMHLLLFRQGDKAMVDY
jgi:hypothetical protein